jgi:DNA mismatch repair protein MutL
MPRIIVLDEHMVNMIAAGEVIERPASVVKELVENSIDAGATGITVTLEDGGRKLIAVADDGGGMDAQDLALAFEPHATSKVRTPKDLACISSMGFRGEALASVASVAQVKAVSRSRDSAEGSCIEIDCGRKGPVRPCGSPVGTMVEVHNLFYKLPARRKFLRTANTEIAHIVEQFTRLALAHVQLTMTLVHNGRELYRLHSGQHLNQRLEQLFSRQLASEFIEVDSQEKGLHIFALMGRPESARTTSRLQYVFLNGRYIRDRFISHAVKDAYQGLIEPNRFPVVFVFLQMPFEAYDVNVHPAKLEVRFDNPNLVHSQVLAVMREKLLAAKLDVKMRMPVSRARLSDEQSVPDDLEARRRQVTEAMAEFFKHHPALPTQQQLGFRGCQTAAPAWGPGQPQPPQTIPSNDKALQRPGEQMLAPPLSLPRPRFFQLHDSYIVAEVEDGFVVIDQHALHERIIYEDLCRRIADGVLQSQRLAFPESFQLTQVQAVALRENAELIERLGIELEPFGPQTVAIQAFPVVLEAVPTLQFVRELLDMLAERAGSVDPERLLHEVLDMAACKSAVKAGQKLTDGEMERMLSARESLQRASYCPHGRPTTIKVTLDELRKQFKRKSQ